jgi:thiol-disulfide isomerase/thioredoxin
MKFPRGLVLLFLVFATLVPVSGAGGALALRQESPAKCASARWIGSSATPEAAPPELATPEIASTAPAWMTITLVDACTSVPFTLADFSGKTVYLEPMATWCVNCRAQMTRVAEAAARLTEAERDEIVLVALSSEVDLSNEALAEYAAAQDLPFLFAVMTPEMLKAMAEDVGREVSVPPATPHLIVSPDGTIGDLHTGGASVDDLLALFAAAGESS